MTLDIDQFADYEICSTRLCTVRCEHKTGSFFVVNLAEATPEILTSAAQHAKNSGARELLTIASKILAQTDFRTFGDLVGTQQIQVIEEV